MPLRCVTRRKFAERARDVRHMHQDAQDSVSSKAFVSNGKSRRSACERRPLAQSLARRLSRAAQRRPCTSTACTTKSRRASRDACAPMPHPASRNVGDGPRRDARRATSSTRARINAHWRLCDTCSPTYRESSARSGTRGRLYPCPACSRGMGMKQPCGGWRAQPKFSPRRKPMATVRATFTPRSSSASRSSSAAVASTTPLRVTTTTLSAAQANGTASAEVASGGASMTRTS